MASLLTERQQGSLLSNSEVNPRGEGKEYCKAITLRSGREFEILGQQLVVREGKLKRKIRSARKIRCKGSGSERRDQLMIRK